MTGRERDDSAGGTPSTAWHNRTATLLGASVAALAVIAVLVGAISLVSRQANEPAPASTDFVEPTYSVTESGVQTPTTTATITSTSPPVTTDINPESTTPSTETTESTESRRTTRPPRTREDDDDQTTTSSTRKRPRTNVTRTLTPAP